ncbi:NAD(P)-dependent dehydrogenase (short-subunit alcohol dehydrogenase family) [Streptomyces sp. V4I23]|uniref:SDR family oxidoreductase n=1 Tax=Streptomyces sp. V4I23 TaxID=3042282 RepID=UPI00278B054E|nr:SDR family NAD(P)-dependent oxidoreductase [Streptomyces sp. V4I23]MDQ1006196.1 NAD(P)-dependent dehydrogenase (short-subunit alcohol dehydrogenase family) [Streptomyces sp. V4I23]
MGHSDPAAGPVVLLTGAGGPVAAVTERLSAHGARVALAGAIAHGAAALTTPGSPVLALPCRADDPAGLGRAVDTVVDRFGRLDHLVNLVGAGPQASPLMELDPLALREVLQRDLVMPMACVQRAYWRWMAAHGGSVVNVVADVVRDAPRNAALAGLTELTEWLSAELAPRVDVHTVVPSPSLGPDAYRSGIAEVLCELLARPVNRAHGPVLVLTEHVLRAPRAA